MTLGLNVVLLGVIISIIFYEITDISPGGIIVPGLLVLYIKQPERIVYTIIIGILTYLIVKFISKYLIIFGKRRFVIMIFVSIVLNILLGYILSWTSISMLNISVIGFTISGLIANDIYKQGLRRTIPSLVIVLAIIELVIIVIGQVGL